MRIEFWETRGRWPGCNCIVQIVINYLALLSHSGDHPQAQSTPYPVAVSAKQTWQSAKPEIIEQEEARATTRGELEAL